MKKLTFLIVLFVTIVQWGYAQTTSPATTESIYKMYTDTLPGIYNRHFAAVDSLYYNDTIPQRYIKLNPYYFQLFMPLTYYYSPVAQAFRTDWEPQQLKDDSYSLPDSLLKVKFDFNGLKKARRQVDDALLAAYMTHPDWVEYTEAQISKRKIMKLGKKDEMPPKVKVFSLFEPESSDNAGSMADMEMIVRKPNFWTSGGEGSVQFTQNYISDNWYKGGESTNSMVAQLRLFANYDDKQRVEFDNEMSFNLGFLTAPSDTVHRYRTNNDLFRINSKLGVKAFLKWYYTLAVEFRTQFFSNYKTNSNVKQSALMTPTEFKLGVGMDYKLNRKKITLSLLLSPVSYNFLYLMDGEVAPSAFGVKEGERVLNEVGSRLQMNYMWKIIPSITWESRLSYFTNYHRVEAEWENTFNFILNRYLSTKLFVHARYDDSVGPTNGNSYFQLKELLSFGINYRW